MFSSEEKLQVIILGIRNVLQQVGCREQTTGLPPFA